MERGDVASRVAAKTLLKCFLLPSSTCRCVQVAVSSQSSDQTLMQLFIAVMSALTAAVYAAAREGR